eukprot:7907794-Pyramimonas_sp.AAC.1
MDQPHGVASTGPTTSITFALSLPPCMSTLLAAIKIRSTTVAGWSFKATALALLRLSVPIVARM